MAESVLSQLVKTDKETKDSLKSIDTNLAKIYKLQVANAKSDAAHKKRLEQEAKRKKGDRLLGALGKKKPGDKKKDKKGLLESLFGGGLGKLVTAGLLLKALGIGAIGAAIVGYIGSEKFRKFVNEKIIFPVGDFIKNTLLPQVNKLFKDAINNIGESVQNWLQEKTKGGMFSYKSDLNPTSKEIPLSLMEILGAKDLAKEITKDKSLSKDEKDLAIQATRNFVEMEERAKSISKLQSDKNFRLSKIKVLENEINDLEIEGDNKALIQAKRDTINRFKEEIKKYDTQIEQNEEIMKGLLAVEVNGKMNNELMLKLINIMRKNQAETLNKEYKPYKIEDFRQNGGPITVPGTGSGDKVPMMLPPGSFVLNRNAAGYQNGGIPTLLEPGESVYGPGQWGMKEFLLNKAIPRFQTGGEVNHPDTGSGFTPSPNATDHHGRPVVLSKEASESFKKMMSNGVNASDVYSSKRSPAKNAAVKGSPTSNHLSGNAVDIHGASKIWMKANGENYGWKWLDYSGHDGHFDFIKGATPIKEGDENTDDLKKQKKQSGFEGFMSSLSDFGGVVGNVLGAIGKEFMDVFGSEMSGISKLLFGGMGSLFDMGGGSEDGGSNYTGQSNPLPGSIKENAKMMYDYIKDKGYSSAQAKGIIANIYRESSFNPAAVGDSGTSHGLFQMHAERSSKMRNSVPNWETNWKGQIDQALTDDRGPDYKSATAGMSAGDAAYWWQKYFERPADTVAGGPNDRKQRDFIASLGFQKGGVVNMKGTASSTQFRQDSEKQFIEQLAAATSPVIIPMPTGGGSNAGAGSIPIGTQTEAPALSAYPSNEVALDLSYRLSMGASFS